MFDCRDSYARTLEALAAEDPRIVAVVNDSVGSSKLVKFREMFPDQLVNVGIAEQNMVGVGAGLANGGKVPFVSGAACFLTARALEQIKADVAYSNADVKLCGISSGVAYGELGATHRYDRGGFSLNTALVLTTTSNRVVSTKAKSQRSWTSVHLSPSCRAKTAWFTCRKSPTSALRRSATS
jgi:deoxyxylulose-5-phosphate synthase